MSLLAEVQAVQANADLIYDTATVETAITRVANEINQQLTARDPLVLCVMNGGVIFAGKLLSQLNIPLTIDAINASRYNNTTSGSSIKWVLKPQASLAGRTILLLDDILDEGITLHALYDYCLEQGATAVYTAVLLDKQLGKEKPISADFVGLTVVDRYLFGYGMDYKGYLRNAAGIYACKDL